jgi:hypothetical protein
VKGSRREDNDLYFENLKAPPKFEIQNTPKKEESAFNKALNFSFIASSFSY